MSNRKTLNRKMITKCTIRFRDPEFSDELENLYNRIGGSQNAFFNLLVKEGYKNVKPLYEKEEIPVSDSFKGVLGEEIIKGIENVRNVILELSDMEIRELKALADEVYGLAKLLSCIYNIYTMGLDDETKDILELGGLDRIPKRFQKIYVRER